MWDLKEREREAWATENELEQRCFGATARSDGCDQRFTDAVWGKKSLRKGQNKTVDSNQSHK